MSDKWEVLPPEGRVRPREEQLCGVGSGSARSGWARIAATRTAREYASAALRAGQLQLQQGQVTPLEILTLQQGLTAARSDEIRALVDYNKAVTTLLEREGTLLEERGLTVNVH